MTDYMQWAAYVKGIRILVGVGPQTPESIANMVRAEGHKHHNAIITVKRARGDDTYETTVHRPQAKAA